DISAGVRHCRAYAPLAAERIQMQFNGIPQRLMQAEQATAKIVALPQRRRPVHRLGVVTLVGVDRIVGGFLPRYNQTTRGPRGSGGSVVLARDQPAVGGTAITRADSHSI